jgi:hypothetical protein
MKANRPSSVFIKVIKLLGQIKQINDRARYSEKSIVKITLLILKFAGKIAPLGFVQLS